MIIALETVLFNYTKGCEPVTCISSLNKEFRVEFNDLRINRLKSSIAKMELRFDKTIQWILTEITVEELCISKDPGQLIDKKNGCKKHVDLKNLILKISDFAISLFDLTDLQYEKIAIISSLDFHMQATDVQNLANILSRTKNATARMLFSKKSQERLNALLLLPEPPPASLVNHTLEKVCALPDNFLSFFHSEMIPFFAQYEEATSQILAQLNTLNQPDLAFNLMIEHLLSIDHQGIYLDRSTDTLMVGESPFRALCELCRDPQFSNYHAKIIEMIKKITPNEIVERAINEYKTTLGLL